jgi:hypothetical protein
MTVRVHVHPQDVLHSVPLHQADPDMPSIMSSPTRSKHIISVKVIWQPNGYFGSAAKLPGKSGLVIRRKGSTTFKSAYNIVILV